MASAGIKAHFMDNQNWLGEASTVVMLLARDREPVLDPKGHGAALETRNDNTLLEGQPPRGRTK